MRSCKEITKLISLSHERELTFFERTELKFHLFICKSCREFNKNLETLRKTFKEFNQPNR